MNIQRPTFNVQHSTRQGGAGWWLVALLLLAGWSSVFAQVNPPGVGKGVNLVRYYPAPNFRQMQLKLTGAEASQLPGTNIQLRITRPTFISFQENGEVEIVIETPECIFDEADSKARRVSSAQELVMRTGDGRFGIKGKGFLWRQNEKVLIISNDVHAVVQWTNNAPPLEITSRWFEFDAARRRGVFHDNVRGEDTNQVFTCELLAISAGTNQAFQNPLAGAKGANRTSFDLIEAEGGLEITGIARPGYAKARSGSFRQAEQRVDLVGDADWNFNGYSGKADRLTVWMVNTNIDAAGKVKLTLPRGALGAAGGLLSATNAPTKKTDTNTVTLFADRFSKRGEQLLAEGSVRVIDGTNQLTCDRLEGKATPKSPEGFASATGHVFVGREGGGIYSERADYSKATGQVLFTGNSRPRFVQGEVSGTAGRVIAQPASNEVLADGDVVVTFPLAAGSGTFLDFLPNEQTNRVEQANRPDQKVSITARTFRLHEQLATFAGNVKAHQLPADGSEPRLHCGELEVRLAAGRKAESLQARQDVVCERGIVGVTNGPAELIYTRMECETLTANAQPATGELVDLVAGGGVRIKQADGEARGEKAVYTRADQLLKLLGQSVIDRPEAIYTSSQGLTWHIATKQVVGSYDSVSIKPAALKRAGELEKLPPNE